MRGCHQHKNYSSWRGEEDTTSLWPYLALTLGSETGLMTPVQLGMPRKFQGL